MAFNIMDLIKDQITPDNIGAIAGMLGEDEKKTSSGIAGAIPAVLGGLIGAVAKPEGEAAFGQAVEQADPGLIGNVMGALGGGTGSSLVSGGVTMLSSMFGDNKLTTLIGAIAGFSGLSKGSSKSLLGLAAPVLMSMLSKKGKDDGLDSKGLIGMLMGQKDNIAKAIPGDLGNALAGSGLLDTISGGERAPLAAVSAPPPSAPPPRAEPAAPVAEEEKQRSWLGILLTLAVIAAAGWFAYQYFMKPSAPAPASAPTSTPAPAASQPATLSAPAPAPAPAQTSEAVSPAAALTQTVTGLIQRASKTLTGVSDVASANAGLATLQQVDSELGQAVSDASALTTAQRESLSASVTEQIPGLQGPTDQAMALPGVSDVIGTTMTSMVDKLKQLMQRR